MKICDLVPIIADKDKADFLRLWKSRWLTASQDALFTLWCAYNSTYELKSLLGTTCGKCRARLIGRIGLLITELNKTHNDTQH